MTDTILSTDQRSNETQGGSVGADFLDRDQFISETQHGRVPVDPSAGSQTESDHQLASASGILSTDDQETTEIHIIPVVGGPLCTPDQRSGETHVLPVGCASSSSQPPTTGRPIPISVSSDGWLELRIWAEMFDDAQKARIAQTNRAERGGLDPDIYQAHLETLRVAEHQCGLAMRRCFRKLLPAPIVQWQKNTKGIGEHLLARLLGQVGHPVWATPHHWEGTGTARVLVTDPPFNRTVGQLWQYCGHGAPARKRKGMSAGELAAMGNPSSKMVLHLLAEACMKTMSSPFRLVYEQARADVVDKTHTVECVRCGPSGKPAQIGDPWSLGHQHAHALRIVGKEILRDLWLVAGGV